MIFSNREDKHFLLKVHDVKTGKKTKYSLQRNEWSIHFNSTKDDKLFCGDGGDPGQVAKAPDGQWIYLFKPDRRPLRIHETREHETPYLQARTQCAF